MNSNSNNTETIRTKSIPTAAALASVDPLRSVIEIEPIIGAREWLIICVVTCPNARELWARLHPAPGKPVEPLLTDPRKTLSINQAIFKTSAKLRDGISTVKRINCWEVCNG